MGCGSAYGGACGSAYARGRADRRRAPHARCAILAALVTAGACGGGAGGGPGGGATSRVTIPAGATFAAAVDSLGSAGVVRRPALFRLYAKLRGRDRDVKAGTYLLERGMSWSAALDALARGRGIEKPVTVPEGYAIAEIVPLLAAALGAPQDSVLAATRDTALLHQLDIPTATLEGYLFPDTYQLPYGTSPRAAVREMVNRFTEMWDRRWNARLQQLALSRHDIVTLASIIEKEARLGEERPVISAVYHNRLRAHMPLQADPTIQYALGHHTARVLYKDLEVDSPYNTYRHAGLPPGPIASPGRASIEAALFPANVPYLYFVAHPDGHHEFRQTFKEHTEAREEIRQERARER